MWSAKFISGHCAVGQTMLCHKQWDHSKCPCCTLPDETTQHVLQCLDPSLCQAYHSGVASLCQWLTSMHTDPHILACFCDPLLDTSHWEFPFFASLGYTLAAQDQATISKFCTSMGCLAHSWKPLQAQYLKSIGSLWSTSCWFAQFVRKLMELSHSLWRYCNSVLHAQNEQGCASALLQLQSQINLQFSLGIHDLLPADQVYITWFSNTLLRCLPLPDQESWLAAVQLTREHS